MELHRRLDALLLLAGLTAVAASAHAQAGPPAPLEAYGRLPSIEDAALSPDGSKLAFVLTSNEVRSASVVGLAEDRVLGAVRLGEEKLRDIEWADNRRLLITTASSRMPFALLGHVEWHLMQSYDVVDHKTRPLLEHVREDMDKTQTMNVVFGRPVVQRTGTSTILYLHGVYVNQADRQTEMALFKIDLDSGAESLVKRGSPATMRWLVDDNGAAVAEDDYFDDKRRWEIRLLKGVHVDHRLSGEAALDPPYIIGASADGSAAIVAVPEADGTVWKRLSLHDGNWGDEISPEESMSRLIRDQGSDRMIGMAYVGDEVRYRFVDPEVQRRWDWVERVFWKERVQYVDSSLDHTRFLVTVLGPKSGYAYYVADAQEHVMRRVGPIYAGVSQTAEMRKIRYAAADGREIPAYLTLPPGRPEKNLPVIILPHGGPQARDEPGFDWLAQALAGQGYAVLQPNYRGSDLGHEWVAAGYGEFGRKMQTDLSDGLHHLAKSGIVDPARACILGASYGGYAALAGAALQPGTYRCAVAIAGISDPAAMLRWEREQGATRDNISLRYWDRFMGVDGPNDRRLDEISPLKHADAVAAPVLLVHGHEDTVVPYEQSEFMAKALKRAGKPVQFVALDKEDHHLSRSATRLQTLSAAVAFLRQYNPPD